MISVITYGDNLHLPNGHIPSSLNAAQEAECREFLNDYGINKLKAELAVGTSDIAMTYWATLYINSENDALKILADSINNTDINKAHRSISLIVKQNA